MAAVQSFQLDPLHQPPMASSMRLPVHAGFETTCSLVTGLLWHLSRSPEALQKVGLRGRVLGAKELPPEPRCYLLKRQQKQGCSCLLGWLVRLPAAQERHPARLPILSKAGCRGRVVAARSDSACPLATLPTPTPMLQLRTEQGQVAPAGAPLTLGALGDMRYTQGAIGEVLRLSQIVSGVPRQATKVGPHPGWAALARMCRAAQTQPLAAAARPIEWGDAAKPPERPRLPHKQGSNKDGSASRGGHLRQPLQRCMLHLHPLPPPCTPLPAQDLDLPRAPAIPAGCPLSVSWGGMSLRDPAVRGHVEGGGGGVPAAACGTLHATCGGQVWAWDMHAPTDWSPAAGLLQVKGEETVFRPERWLEPANTASLAEYQHPFGWAPPRCHAARPACMPMLGQSNAGQDGRSRREAACGSGDSDAW